MGGSWKYSWRHCGLILRKVKRPRSPAMKPLADPAQPLMWTTGRAVRLSKFCGSHVNYVVPDTKRWEQSAAYYVDKHPAVHSFVKNAGLGFAIPYLHNGQMHDYMPD